jgi:nucleoside-diphosphate-sugar epimerase
MDKVAILGVFDFVSFHVCKALLNKGIEVEGIHVEATEAIEFLDEKRLEIGRNANFTEASLVDWTNDFNRKAKTIIFSLYDIYMLFKESILETETADQIIELLKRNKDNEKIVFLVPLQVLSKSIDSKAIHAINHFIKKTNSISENIQFVYLPSVYGPWQPETFVFQHSILTNMKRNYEFKEIREETNDALYIDNAVEVMIEIIEDGKAGGILIESGRENQWDRCASFLQIPENLSIVRKTKVEGKQISKVQIKKQTEISEAFSKQKEHTQRINV